MAKAADKNRWSHTAELMALIANCHRDPDRHRQPFTAAEINPYARDKHPKINGALSGDDMRETLRGAFF